jgi:hypothetical protein
MMKRLSDISSTATAGSPLARGDAITACRNRAFKGWVAPPHLQA